MAIHFLGLPGNQVAQSVRAETSSPSAQALHAAAAAQHGQVSAAVAVLALASGDGSFDANGNLLVTTKHVEARWGGVS